MKSKNILIVETKDQDRKLLEHVLGHLYESISFNTCAAALKYMAQHRVDLVLLSLELTELDPIVMFKKTKQLLGESSLVVALAATQRESDNSFLRNFGYDDFLFKPIKPKDVLQLIQKLFAKQAEAVVDRINTKEQQLILNREILNDLLRLSSREVIHQVFADFIQECNAFMAVVANSSHEIINEEILRTLHTIKGNSGTLGAEKIHAAAKQSESLGRQQKTIEFTESLHYLQVSIAEFQEIIRKEESLQDA